MKFGSQRLSELLSPVRSRVASVSLQQHEDKILVLLTILIGAIVGLIVVAFVTVTEHLGRVLLTAGPAQRLITPVLGSFVGGWLLFRFFPDARGSGIPQTRVALLLQRGFIGIRTVVGKFICSSISLGSGVALGREGPSVHIGAGIASVLARNLGLGEKSVRSLIPVGTAAAIAAAFNTPLAAILFTLEEILADLHAGVVGTVVLGAATSWIVLRLILGDEPLFHVPPYQLVHPGEFLIYAVLGLLGALVSTVFVKLLLRLRIFFLRTPSSWKPFTPVAGGLVVGLLALAVPGVIGVGYNLVGDALNGQMALQMMLLLLALKIVATATSYSSGNAGGIFGPSLFIGAMLGGVVGHVAHTLLPDHTGNAGAYALVGMGAAFAGIIRTPMTSVIMIFELTRDYTIIVPLMIANLCSYLLAQRLQPKPIYEALAHQEGITMPSAAHWPEPLTVDQAMRALDPENMGIIYSPANPHVHPDHPLDMALQRMAAADLDELPVLSRVGGSQLGVLSTHDVWNAYQALAQRSNQVRPIDQAKNWLPAVTAVTITVVLIISGIVYWQRTHQSQVGDEAYRSGEKLLAQGRIDEAVRDLRTALAQNPSNPKRRAALGLALVKSGHFDEASSYLAEATKVDSTIGPAWSGLAQIALVAGDKPRALQLFQKCFSNAWSAADETMRRQAQFDYATLLADAGRQNEAVSLLVSMIGLHGDDPAMGKKAADAIRTIGTPAQAEEAYKMLATQFPADDSNWLKLGDARFAQGKEALALDAYRRAVAADPHDLDANRAVMRSEEVLKLDPTPRGLSVKERARRWDEILQRTILALSPCVDAAKIESSKTVLAKRTFNLEVTDEKMKAALELWRASPSCRTDPVLAHILAKFSE